jgi:hypothetical protein
VIETTLRHRNSRRRLPFYLAVVLLDVPANLPGDEYNSAAATLMPFA